jgi:DNA invertase Pin-like site-specific DNA recombinase
MAPLNPPINLRNGHTLKVLGIARISTEHQDRLSLDDQEALLRNWLTQHTDLSFDLVMIKGRGSGECLDRKEVFQAEEQVATRNLDLVIAEDLGRIFRRVHAQFFCESCEDCDTRLIAINDHIDTAQDNWRVLAGFATMRHEMYNSDTAKRIRRSHRNRFLQGGVVQTVPFGYLKPPGAKTDAEIQKDPNAEPIYAEMFRRLEERASYAEVADWLNEQGVKPGSWARTRRWTRGLVTQLIHNSILKGIRVRNKKMAKRVNQTGRRKSIPAPLSERLERPVPHLAFIEANRYDRLIRMLDERNAKFRRKGINGVDPRKDVPKKRTVWPGQHITCGICGRLYVYGGHGQKSHLMCQGAHQYCCWNGLAVDGPDAATRLLAAIRREIAYLPEFDSVFLQMVEEELNQGQGGQDHRRHELATRKGTLDRALSNLMEAIKETAHSPTLLQELKRLEHEKDEVNEAERKLEHLAKQKPCLPSVAEVKALAEEAFQGLAVTSQEFGRLLRLLVPSLVVRPFRLCDGGRSVLRAYSTLTLAPLLPQGLSSGTLEAALKKTLEVDLYDPPQRETYRVPVEELAREGLTQDAIAQKLRLTQTVVSRPWPWQRRCRKRV